MNDLVLFLALALFVAAAVMAAIGKAWPVALLAVGLALLTLASTGLITG